MMPASDLTPISRVLDALAAAGANPRQAGPNQWTARCPVTSSHKGGDRNPSLSVAEGAQGKALITCHRGCTLPTIADALNLGMRDLFPKPEVVVDIDQPRRIVATYPYFDADGELLFEVVRYKPKTFRQRRPDGRGGYAWGLADLPKEQRPIYNLPQVRKAIAEHRMIWVVEGEKDAENLQWHINGGVATCNSGGAGAWLEHHSHSLHGGMVTVVPDNDDVGRRHAAQIANSLFGKATVRIVRPGQHKDASEALKAGLMPLHWDDVDPAEWMPWADITPPDSEPEPASPIVLDWSEFWNTDHAVEDWLIEPLLPAGRAIAIYAPAKTGKSIVLLSLIAAACTGRSVWGLPPRPPVRILYLDYEMTPADLKERLELLGYGPDDDLSNLRYALIPSLPPLDTPEGGQALLALAQDEQVQGTIVDTIGRATQGEENDADPLRAYYRHTGSLLKKHGIASGRTDHAGKDLERGQRGTSAKNDDVDVVWKLGRTDDGVRISRTHSRMTWVPETIDLVRHEYDNGTWEFRRNAMTNGWPAGTREAADLLENLGVPLNTSARKAQEALKEAGHGMRAAVVRHAIKFRKQLAERAVQPVDNPQKRVPDAVADTKRDAVGTHLGTHPQLAGETDGTRYGTRPDAPSAAQRDAVPPLRGDAVRASSGQPAADNLDDYF